MNQLLVQPERYNSTKAERESFWLRAIEQQKQSRLSRQDFCNQQGLDRSAFSRWHHKLKKNPIKSSNNLGLSEVNKSKADASPAFIAMTSDLAQESKCPTNRWISSAGSHDFQLILRNGLVLTFSNDFDSIALQKLLPTLEVL